VGGDEKLTSVRNVCGWRFLYSPMDDDGQRNWKIDQKIGDLEAVIGQVWLLLIDKNIDLQNLEIRSGLSLFIASTYLRNPRVRDFLKALHDKLVKDVESVPKGIDGIPAVKSIKIKGKEIQFDPSDWFQYKNWSDNDHHKNFTESIAELSINLAEQLIAKRWSVISAEKDVFITSDNPVVLQHPTNSNPGFSTADAVVYFPLSPKRILILDDKHSEPDGRYYQLNAGAEAAIDFLIWRGANRFLITGRDVKAVLQEIVDLDSAL
jgi:Protein of unknown function (DUF4238)